MKNLNRQTFIRELARRTGFTVKDTREFFNAFCELVEDAIDDEVELDLRGLFHLSYNEMRARNGFDAFRNVPKKFGATTMIVINPSRNLKEILRDKRKLKERGEDPIQ